MPDPVTTAGVNSETRRAIGALLFLAGATYTVDAIGGVNSSPWTAERAGADPEDARSCREYVWHAIVMSGLFSGVASLTAGTWWPLVGAGLQDIYLYWLYERALTRAAMRGRSQSFDAFWGTDKLGKAA